MGGEGRGEEGGKLNTQLVPKRTVPFEFKKEKGH